MGLALGFDVEHGDVVEDGEEAVELLDALGDGAGWLERIDKVAQAVEVCDVGGFDDVAEDDDEGNKGRVQDRPGISQLIVSRKEVRRRAGEAGGIPVYI